MKLICERIVTFEDGAPRLVGGRSTETGRIVFPMPEGGEAARYESVPLKREGRLWSYTVQRFPPKSPPYIGPNDPANFKPFALGYVELDGEVIVETRIETEDFEALKVGLPMELTMIEFARDETGAPIHTYAFRPA